MVESIAILIYDIPAWLWVIVIGLSVSWAFKAAAKAWDNWDDWQALRTRQRNARTLLEHNRHKHW